MTWKSICVALALASLSIQQSPKDPLKDFCRRWGHQTAVVDNKLLIDGYAIQIEEKILIDL